MAVYWKTEFTFFSRLKRTTEAVMTDSHYHYSCELYYLQSGKTTYFVDDKIYVLSPGDFIFVPTGSLHKTSYRGSPNSERVILEFTDEFVGEEYRSYLEDMTRNKHIILDPEGQKYFQQIFKKIEEECDRHLPEYQAMQKLYLRQILVLIARYRVKYTEAELFGARRLVQKSIVYIHNNYQQEITVQDLAKRYSISPNYFSSQFKKITGITPTEYVTLTRINAAKELLETTNKSIIQVASECGFNNSDYFTQVFKRITGTTPKKYASQYQKDGKETP